MKETVIKNAKIISTMLGTEDYGILTCYITLDYGDSGCQGFGGYSLDNPVKDPNGKHMGREGTAYGMKFIQRILTVVGVNTWEDLKGQHCRVEGSFDKIERIGHLIKNVWFDPKDLKVD